MRRKSGPLSAALLIALVACLAPAGLSAQQLSRWVAEFRFGPEQVSFATPPGTLIYQKVFFLPVTERTLFVTLSTTGDAHEGNSHWFSTQVNGQFCNPGDEGAGFAPPGWIPLQKHFDYDNVTYTTGGVSGVSGGDGGGGQGDMHDNGIYYTWCCPGDLLRPGANNAVQIFMATSFANNPVFIERSHFYIDSVNTKLCNQADPVPAPVDPAPLNPSANGKQ
ncbi:MAG TPA: hypothetical protein VGX68_08795 [Thermoanaerobaculia bacterium]|nr:hypothetical protein [Thermoanaerobaculia bacterium]